MTCWIAATTMPPSTQSRGEKAAEAKAAALAALPDSEKKYDDVEVEVKTWNNALSDITDNTLIPQTSKTYDTLSELGRGKRIKFSGSFINGDEKNGFRESSLSEQGSMTDPEFIFRFSQVSGGGG
jgi:hypothetical protein